MRMYSLGRHRRVHRRHIGCQACRCDRRAANGPQRQADWHRTQRTSAVVIPDEKSVLRSWPQLSEDLRIKDTRLIGLISTLIQTGTGSPLNRLHHSVLCLMGVILINTCKYFGTRVAGGVDEYRAMAI